MAKQSRRHLVDFDPDYFGRRAESTGDRRGTFREAFRKNVWGGASRSGPGSSSDQTARIAAELPSLLARLGVRRLLDVPCGDFSWLSTVNLGAVDYVGGDIVPDIVAANRAEHGGPGRTFLELDLVSADLPPADLLLCRDCLVHLSHADALDALRNIAGSNIDWLLTTTFPDEEHNLDITTGDWRPIDLSKPPFDLPPAAELLNEGCTEQDGAFADKSLGLWAVEDLRSRFE